MICYSHVITLTVTMRMKTSLSVVSEMRNEIPSDFVFEWSSEIFLRVIFLRVIFLRVIFLRVIFYLAGIFCYFPEIFFEPEILMIGMEIAIGTEIYVVLRVISERVIFSEENGDAVNDEENFCAIANGVGAEMVRGATYFAVCRQGNDGLSDERPGS